MRFYLSKTGNGDPLKKELWFPEKTKPSVPYVELQVTVVRREPDYDFDRKKICRYDIKRFFRFLKRRS